MATMKPPVNQGDGIALELTQFDTHFCLYAVSIVAQEETLVTPATYQLHYIGVCKIAKVFQMPDGWRNTEFQKTIRNGVQIRIQIMSTHEFEAPLYAIQTRWVKEYKPHCNHHGYNQSHTRTVIHCVEGPNAGDIYYTQSQAARVNGVAQPTLSNHLNGVVGYETIRGMKFKRGMPSTGG